MEKIPRLILKTLITVKSIKGAKLVLRPFYNWNVEVQKKTKTEIKNSCQKQCEKPFDNYEKIVLYFCVDYKFSFCR